MVVCTCGRKAVVKTSWTYTNPGRRFYGCPSMGSDCPFLGWFYPPMCPRSVEIIPGLLRRINVLEEVADFFEEQLFKYRNISSSAWFFLAVRIWIGLGLGSGCGFVGELMPRPCTPRFGVLEWRSDVVGSKRWKTETNRVSEQCHR
ncbi:zinc finger, GRF-type [Artemisia annua]|uniref:Zinc finger, GRF-type n=1 Tax=Artemisia annua TaxID=35608 RepID=A0A2U1NSP0_ARTAN|nr:zinc finger, GRF-type [Artemisia annua]